MSSVTAAGTPVDLPKDSQKYNYFFLVCFLDTLCINHAPISPATETIKANVCSVINTTALPTIAGNASAAFSASSLSASASLSHYFFKASLFFAGGPPPSPPPPKSPMAESTIVVIPVTIAVSVEIISTNCSRIKVRILSGKCVSL